MASGTSKSESDSSFAAFLLPDALRFFAAAAAFATSDAFMGDFVGLAGDLDGLATALAGEAAALAAFFGVAVLDLHGNMISDLPAKAPTETKSFTSGFQMQCYWEKQALNCVSMQEQLQRGMFGGSMPDICRTPSHRHHNRAHNFAGADACFDFLAVSCSASCTIGEVRLLQAPGHAGL